MAMSIFLLVNENGYLIIFEIHLQDLEGLR